MYSRGGRVTADTRVGLWRPADRAHAVVVSATGRV